VEKLGKSKLYQEEFEILFNDKKSLRTRGVLVISAFIEGQVSLLAKVFLEKRRVVYKPETRQEYYQSLNVLKTNKIINSEELGQIRKFREERNKSVHGIFKGMTRPEWEKQNNKVVELGRPIVKNLDKKLFPEG